MFGLASLVSFDALAAAERLFGNTATANFLVVGAAYQAGAIPISAAAIEDAISLNGVAVQANQAAFRWGRVAVANPEVFRAATAPEKIAQRRRPAVPSELFDGCTVTGTVRELLERRAADLVAYQGHRTATRLITLTQDAWTGERTITDRTELSEAVAKNFFKLIAYKDEYEVARMLTDPAFVESVQSQVPGGEKLTYKLHPPMLKALGRKKKIGMGPRSHFTLRAAGEGQVPSRHVVRPVRPHAHAAHRATVDHPLRGDDQRPPRDTHARFLRQSQSCRLRPAACARVRGSEDGESPRAMSRGWKNSESTPRPSHYRDGFFECANKLHQAIARLSSGRRLGRADRKSFSQKSREVG